MKMIRPFANGTAFTIWHEHNCTDCIKCATDTRKGTCLLEINLLLGNDISFNLAKRYGYSDVSGELLENCPLKKTKRIKKAKTVAQNFLQRSLF